MSKKNRAALRRTLLTLSLVLVVAFAAVGGTIAWLTSTSETVTNTFSVGDVEITLDETDVNLYGEKDGDPRVTENTYKLLPGHTYTKDPIVHVTAGSEPCWVFVKVTNGIEDIVVAGQEDGTIEAQILANGWLELDGVDGVYYKEKVDARETAEGTTLDLPVFESFTINNEAEVADYDGETVTIIAYAIQDDGTTDANDAWTKLDV